MNESVQWHSSASKVPWSIRFHTPRPKQSDRKETKNMRMGKNKSISLDLIAYY